MDISVIICTYNRSGYLKNVLKSLVEQGVPYGVKWEIIVVDNNSKDGTFEVIRDFINHSAIPVTYVKEEKQGLSYARNRGIIESKGEYAAFTDDDAIVEPNWIASIYETFKKYNCDCVGGRIYLKPEKELPRWLKKELWGFLAYLDYGDNPFQITEHYVFGTNMAFSREIFNKVGFLNADLGRTGYVPIGGEETDLVERILRSGGKVYYQPNAKVHHVIEKYKIKKKYFRRLHYYSGLWAGRSYNGNIKKHIYGIPLFILPQFLRSILKYIKNPTLRMQMNILWFLGFMRGRVEEHRKGSQV